jgi:hypothetical protein
MLRIFFQHLAVLGRPAIIFQQRPIKSEFDLQDREMFEVFCLTFHRKGFFDKRFALNNLASLGWLGVTLELKLIDAEDREVP